MGCRRACAIRARLLDRRAEKPLGLDISDAVIEKYESVKDQVDLSRFKSVRR